MQNLYSLWKYENVWLTSWLSEINSSFDNSDKNRLSEKFENRLIILLVLTNFSLGNEVVQN